MTPGEAADRFYSRMCVPVDPLSIIGAIIEHSGPMCKVFAIFGAVMFLNAAAEIIAQYWGK